MDRRFWTRRHSREKDTVLHLLQSFFLFKSYMSLRKVLSNLSGKPWEWLPAQDREINCWILHTGGVRSVGFRLTRSVGTKHLWTIGMGSPEWRRHTDNDWLWGLPSNKLRLPNRPDLYQKGLYPIPLYPFTPQTSTLPTALSRQILTKKTRLPHWRFFLMELSH